MIHTKKIVAIFDVQFNDDQIQPEMMVKLAHDYIQLMRLVVNMESVTIYPVNYRLVVNEIVLPTEKVN